MSEVHPVRIVPAGEAAFLVELADAISPAATDRVLRLTAAVEAANLPGVTDLAPGYVTLLVLFDPALVDADTLATALLRLAASSADAPLPAGKLVTIPVVYGGEHGPDLPRLSAQTGLSETEVIARHAAATYRVACPGFVPGWAYLEGLPPELATPRLRTPRARVPAGSVAIGGVQTGVYPSATPGGWNLIGRSPLRLFDPTAPEPALLLPGDHVRFVPVGVDALTRQPPLLSEGEREHDAVWGVGSPLSWSGRGGPPSGLRAASTATIEVLSPGLLTTVQDLGRPGRMRQGIGRDGALDQRALVLGNRLVGNEPGAAGLEITLTGPRLRFRTATVVAVTGADLGATLDGQTIPRWQPVLVPAGGVVDFRPERASARGARAYLCVAGGIDLPTVLGSRSTALAVGIGGHEGRPLRAGDALPVGAASAPLEALLRRRLAAPPPAIPTEFAPRIILGPQADRFTTEGIANLLGATYRASARSDRMGLRIEGGPPIAHRHGPDLISEGTVPGSIQVPGDARPIVLLNACATAGGYAKVATVIGADLDLLAQVRPGDRVRFASVTPEDARLYALAHRASLGPAAVVDAPTLFGGWSPAGRHEASPRRLAARDGIARLVAALEATRLPEIQVELSTGNDRLRLSLHRRHSQPPTGTAPDASREPSSPA